jgi:hypothetical protein
MVRTSTDSAGAGPYSPADGLLTAGNNMVVYEVLWDFPFTIDFTEIPYSLINAPPGTTLQSILSFAPFYSDSCGDAGQRKPSGAEIPGWRQCMQ